MYFKNLLRVFKWLIMYKVFRIYQLLYGKHLDIITINPASFFLSLYFINMFRFFFPSHYQTQPTALGL